MKRRYTTKRYTKAVNILREYFDNPAISSDVIVGFPGETEELFLESLDFCSKISFATLHVFPYSPREGTPAASMKGHLDKKTKTERVGRLISLANDMENQYLNSLVGTEQEIIVESDSDGVISGRARNYAPIYIDKSKESKLGISKRNLIKCHVSAFENKQLKGVYNGLSVL